MWLGTLVTAVTTAVLISLLQQVTGLTAPPPNPGAAPTPLRPGPSVRVDAVALEHSWQARGGSFLFRDAYAPSAAELEELNNISAQGNFTSDVAYDSWFRSRGAVDPEIVDIQLVVRGNSSQPVRITGMEVDKKCGPPLNGSYFYSPPAGAEDNTWVHFDLDQAAPVAQTYDGREDHGAFFAGRSVSLMPNEQHVFEVRATTEQHFCEFSLVLIFVGVDGVTRQVIANGGAPFVVSAVDKSLRSYSRLYAGGVASRVPPRPDGTAGLFGEANPATFKDEY